MAQQEYKWNYESSPEKFKAAFNNTIIKNKIYNCRQRIEAGLIESTGELIQIIFKEAADLSLEKKRQNTKKAPEKMV